MPWCGVCDSCKCYGVCELCKCCVNCGVVYWPSRRAGCWDRISSNNDVVLEQKELLFRELLLRTPRPTRQLLQSAAFQAFQDADNGTVSTFADRVVACTLLFHQQQCRTVLSMWPFLRRSRFNLGRSCLKNPVGDEKVKQYECFDINLACRVRHVKGQVISAKMSPGPNGFMMASFPNEPSKKVEVAIYCPAGELPEEQAKGYPEEASSHQGQVSLTKG